MIVPLTVQMPLKGQSLLWVWDPITTWIRYSSAGIFMECALNSEPNMIGYSIYLQCTAGSGVKSIVTIQTPTIQHTNVGTTSMSYSIKIINPVQKAEYVIQKLHDLKRIFKSVEEIKDAIEDSCDSSASLPVDSVGYIEPGYGAKGKQRWLIPEADIAEMYKAHQGKKEILLWCYKGCSQKGAQNRAHSPGNNSNDKPPKPSRYDNYLEKMTGVEAIEDELEEKHNKDGFKVFF